MACVTVPLTEALITTVAGKTLSESKNEKIRNNMFVKRRKWLTTMLWGGSALLAFEHIWHGEIVPWFPFLSAAQEGPSAISEMFNEIVTVGVTMAATISLFWVLLVLIAAHIKNKATKAVSNV